MPRSGYLLSGPYEESKLDMEPRLLMASDVHPQPCPAIKRDNVDIFPCLDREEPCAEHEHNGELSIERLSPL